MYLGWGIVMKRRNKRAKKKKKKSCSLLGSFSKWKKLQPKINNMVLLRKRDKCNIGKYTETNPSCREYYTPFTILP